MSLVSYTIVKTTRLFSQHLPIHDLFDQRFKTRMKSSFKITSRERPKSGLRARPKNLLGVPFDILTSLLFFGKVPYSDFSNFTFPETYRLSCLSSSGDTVSYITHCLGAYFLKKGIHEMRITIFLIFVFESFWF